jgi:aspartyl-tRNA(Asn)/glutamyl-tRNA(Gln) amidotransferase subunit A
MLVPGRFVPRADRVRAAIRIALANVFNSVDFIVWPSTPTTAPPLDNPWVKLPSGSVSVDAVNVRQASIANLAGLPAISIPVGLDAERMPVGLQLLGPWGSEARLLDAAEHMERASDHSFVSLAPPLAH